MYKALKEIKNFNGKKRFYVWERHTFEFQAINFEQFEALARYSTCGEFQWQIECKKSNYFDSMNCYLEPKWRD